MITLGILLLWAACWAIDARWYYRRYRPFTEPVSCTYKYHRYRGDHFDSCYARHEDGIGLTRTEAIVFGALFGLLGPLAVIVPVVTAWIIPAVTWVITSGDKQTIEEARASIARLEKENDRLRNRQY